MTMETPMQIEDVKEPDGGTDQPWIQLLKKEASNKYPNFLVDMLM